MSYKYIAIDQYNNVVRIRKNPRKELLECMNASYAQKMYVGDGEHTGYVVSGLRFTVYRIEPLTKRSK